MEGCRAPLEEAGPGPSDPVVQPSSSVPSEPSSCESHSSGGLAICTERRCFNGLKLNFRVAGSRCRAEVPVAMYTLMPQQQQHLHYHGPPHASGSMDAGGGGGGLGGGYYPQYSSHHQQHHRKHHQRQQYQSQYY